MYYQNRDNQRGKGQLAMDSSQLTVDNYMFQPQGMRSYE